MKILIISNDIEQIVKLYPVFTQSDFDPLVELYGKDGIVAANGFEPDIILLDIVLKEGVYVPFFDWEMTLKELKDSAKTKIIPVIIMGDLLMDGYILNARILGAAITLDKARTPAIAVVEECRKVVENTRNIKAK
jgi:DNA-binding response OmpR family regulator